MARLTRCIALLLLALWLPATLHCDLEAAGVTNILGCHDHQATAPAFGTDQHCHSIDGIAYQPGGTALKSPAPAAIVLLAFFHPDALCVPPPAREPIEAVDTSPPGLPRNWQFVVRAAPPVRAPAFAA